MNKILIYYNKDGKEWGMGFIIEETKTHFRILTDPAFRTVIQFPKELFSFEYLTDSLNVL